jgi:ABC-type dipeptide/oligopeptide/nickel transport system ATPase subunit
MAEPILSVRDLHTHFLQDEGVVRAVDGTSFDLYPSRTLGIVGESGCGKSVTARSILRIVEHPGRIVSGEILLRRADGHALDLVKLAADGTDMRAIRGGEIGLVFQEPMSSLSAYHTVGNQLMEAIRLHSTLSKRAARARAIELLAMVGIPRPSRRVDAYSFELSGGLRQRVMIALALAGEPRILIADEPTTALDVTTQAQIRAGGDPDHPRHGCDRRDDRRRGGDVPRPRGGEGPRGRDLPRSAASVYTVVATIDPQCAGRAAGKAGNDSRLDPTSIRASVRLPVPSALYRLCRRRVREVIPRRGGYRTAP